MLILGSRIIIVFLTFTYTFLPLGQCSDIPAVAVHLKKPKITLVNQCCNSLVESVIPLPVRMVCNIICICLCISCGPYQW